MLAAQPVGHYSQAVIADSVVYISGCLGLNPRSNAIVDGGVAAEFRQAIGNLTHILDSAGSSLSKVVKTTVFLKRIDDGAVVNAEYQKVFGDHYPARTTIQAGNLPMNALVEIEAIACLEDTFRVQSCLNLSSQPWTDKSLL